MGLRQVESDSTKGANNEGDSAVSSHSSCEAVKGMEPNQSSSERAASRGALSDMENAVQQMRGADGLHKTAYATRDNWQQPTYETMPVNQYNQADNDGIKAGAQPLKDLGDTSTLTDKSKEGLLYNMSSYQRSIRTGRPMEKLPGADGTYASDGGSFTQKDGQVTQLNFKDGRTISDIKQNRDGEVISATMPDGSKLVPNIRQNQGLVDGTHQQGYNLIARDGTVTRAPFNQAFADKSGFTTMSHGGNELTTTTLSGTSASMDAGVAGYNILTNITTAGGQRYFNRAERPERN